ncbi:hypothetical protein L3Y34_019142 [Caenorhabditis briggsae]|uniref:Uncharacterized protein n=1 Tax=Caenorhabditis briggsae TaxID=6238 RepID=A0AAE9DMX6_CAEBR|nr:hypothetical protein L3Y34_019142 [Caenorhabditis briggsae]
MPVVSYPVLRCISERIEANYRLSLSARCPEISRIEKSIPLRVDRLCLLENMVTINNMEYRIFSKDKRQNQPLTLQLYNSKSKCTVEKTFSRNYEVEVATRKFVEYLLGGRRIIRVKLLIVPNSAYETVQYLFGLSTLKFNALESWGIGLVKLHLLIESPLKELRLRVSHPTVFENLIARTAEKLVIMCDGYDEPDTRLETHRNLLNKEVIIDTFLHDFTDIRIMELIEYWRETRKAVGSSFSVRKVNGDPIEMFLEKVKERFEGTYLKLEQTDTNTFFDVNAVSIKIDSESKIVVYGGRTYRTFPMASKVVIKVMAIGSFEENHQNVN